MARSRLGNLGLGWAAARRRAAQIYLKTPSGEAMRSPTLTNRDILDWNAVRKYSPLGRVSMRWPGLLAAAQRRRYVQSPWVTRLDGKYAAIKRTQ